MSQNPNEESSLTLEPFNPDQMVATCSMNIGEIIFEPPWICPEGHSHALVKVFILKLNTNEYLIPCESHLGVALLEGTLTDLARRLLDISESFGV